MKQVAGHVGAEIGRQRINVQARCKFHALIGGARALCGTRVDCAEPLQGGRSNRIAAAVRLAA